MLWLALGFFTCGILAYLFFPEFSRLFIKGVIAGIVDKFELNTAIEPRKLMLLIFMQNFGAITLALFFGFLLGIVPIIIISFNAFFIGMLLIFVLGEFGLTKFLISLSLLFPHGIFEIPALFIATGFGLRLGFFWKANATKPHAGKLNLRQKLWLCLKENYQLLPLLFVLLFIAAFLEVFVTAGLLKFYFHSLP